MSLAVLDLSDNGLLGSGVNAKAVEAFGVAIAGSQVRYPGVGIST